MDVVLGLAEEVCLGLFSVGLYLGDVVFQVLGGLVIDGVQVQERQFESLSLLRLLLSQLVHPLDPLLLSQHQVREVPLSESPARLELGGVIDEFVHFDEFEDIIIAGSGDELEENARGAFCGLGNWGGEGLVDVAALGSFLDDLEVEETPGLRGLLYLLSVELQQGHDD